MKYFFPRRKLTANEISYVPEALWRLFIACLKITFFRSEKYLPSSSYNSTNLPTKEKFATAKTIAVAINGLSVRTPWSSTCLVKVLATHKMLQKRKIPHTLHFGVKKNPSHQLTAHAWLSVGKEIIIGGGNYHHYKEVSQIII